jgi:hypothetical protein
MIAQTELSGNPIIGDARAVAIGYFTLKVRVLPPSGGICVNLSLA